MTNFSKTRLMTLGLTVAALFLAVGCSSTQPAGVQLDDAGISAKIKTKLAADPEVNPFNIDVDTNEGVVRLSGNVEKTFARSEAERLARNTDGVKRVINDIKIAEGSMGQRLDDAGITAKIKAKIAADPELNPFNINVDSEDGVVTLTGRVESDSDRDEAARIARNTDGVRKVDNRLKVGDMTK